MVMLRRSRCCERRFNAFGMGHLKSSIHLIGGDVIEHLVVVFFGKWFPIKFSGLKQWQRSHHVCASKGERVLNRTVDVAFGCQMDYSVDVFAAHKAQECIKVANVHLYKSVIWLVFNIFQICQIAGISELVEINNLIFWIFVHEQSHYMAANKPGSAGYHYCLLIFHIISITILKKRKRR